MAEKKFLDLLGLQTYDEKIKAYITEADAKVLSDANAYADSLAENYDAAGTAATKVKELADGAVATNATGVADNKAAIEKLNGDVSTDGSVAKAVADAKAIIDADVDAVEKKADDNAADIATLQGEMDDAGSEISGLKDRMTTAEGDIDAIEEDIGNVDDLETANKELVKAINEVRNAVSAGGTAAAITIDTSSTTDGALKSYTVKQGDNVIGTIDIPKDMVVESGSVVTLADNEVAGYAAGQYIKLVLANVADPLYINVGALVDIYTAQANAAQVQINIDSATRIISAAIVAGSIGTAELADNAVVTAKIADKNVTKAKLSTEVQASLDKADVAESNAKAHADSLDEAMDARVAAVENKLGNGEGSVSSMIDAAKAELQGELATAIADAKTDASNKDAVVLYEAQKASTAVQTALDTHTSNDDIHVTAADKVKWNAAADVTSKAHEHSNFEVLEGITSAKVAAWDAAEGNAKTFAQGLNDTMDGRVAALETWHNNFTEVSEAEINALFA